MRSLRTAAEELWPLAAAAPSGHTPDAASEDRTIVLDEPAAEDVTITLTAAGAALNITCAPGREATIRVARGDELVLEETIEV
jgi:hypothetical protein